MKYSMIFLCIIFLSFHNCDKLPSRFKTCDRKQDDFKDCLATAIEDALKQLKRAMPEFDLPTLNPLNLTKLNVPIHEKVVVLEEHIDYLAFTNIFEAKIKDADINFKTKTFHVGFAFAPLKIESQFEITGTILDEPVNEKGHGTGSFDDAVFDVKANFEEYEKNGNKYIKIINSELIWKYKSASIVASESKDMSEEKHLNKLLQEHSNEIFAAIERDYEKLFAGVFTAFFNKVLVKIPVAELFGAE